MRCPAPYGGPGAPPPLKGGGPKAVRAVGCCVRPAPRPLTGGRGPPPLLLGEAARAGVGWTACDALVYFRRKVCPRVYSPRRPPSHDGRTNIDVQTLAYVRIHVHNTEPARTKLPEGHLHTHLSPPLLLALPRALLRLLSKQNGRSKNTAQSSCY